MIAPIVIPAYSGNVQYYSILSHFSEVYLEQYSHYIKQTYRNRCQILTANGVMNLTIPVDKISGEKMLDKDVRISNTDWQRVHWGAIESAYNNSPFFLYYSDDIRPMYEKKYEFLLDFNLELQEVLLSLLGLDVQLKLTEHYIESSEIDFREKLSPKYKGETPNFNPKPYYQVFKEKFGFVENLSIYDLLFNMGNESILVLKDSYIK
ncbi:MAG: WbqC family protein [Paludibacteraceae bacterium]|nr:WbqC family protein [Paludibacteraceae bacterium]